MPPAGTTSIAPIFDPLRIEYSWEGAFEYDRRNEGHIWTLAAKPRWRRIHLKVTGGGHRAQGDGLQLSDSARRYTDAIRDELLTKANSVSHADAGTSEWQLLNWLRNRRTRRPQDKRVGRGLSLVLNALVRQSTLKPFDILSSFVRDDVTVEVRELGNHIPCWFYVHLPFPFCDLDEYLICFPELFLNRNGRIRRAVEEFFHRLLHVRCKHHYEVLRVEQDDDKIRVTLRDKAVITEYVKAAVCGCIAVPGQCPRKEKRSEPEGINSPEVVVTTPVVRNALVQLSRVWQDPYAKSVLISSPPGSGKEVFANSIPVGNGRPPDKVFALSMASDDQRGIERQLYGFGRADGSVQDGLIAMASGAALFLDEVHQPEKDKTSAARASLLRTLEAGTYFPLESLQRRDVQNVLWVLATSKTLEQLAEFKPVDFWTRMTHAMRIPHPLDLDAPESDRRPEADKPELMARVVADFFRSFWWDLCDKQYEIDPSGNPNSLRTDVIPAYWRQRSMLRVIVDEDGKPVTGERVRLFASGFLENLRQRRMRPHEFSVRGIRNMVMRLFAIAWSNVAQGREPWDSDEAFENDVKKIFTEIQNVARLS